MTKVKTYWDKIKNDETHFSGGDYGWEVHLRREEYYDWKKREKIFKLQLQWPYFDKTVPRSERKKCREEVTQQVRLRRELAKASRDRSEYLDLQARIYDLSFEEKNELLKKGIKGFNLGSYIRHNYLTHAEAHSLFWRM